MGGEEERRRGGEEERRRVEEEERRRGGEKEMRRGGEEERSWRLELRPVTEGGTALQGRLGYTALHATMHTAFHCTVLDFHCTSKYDAEQHQPEIHCIYLLYYSNKRCPVLCCSVKQNLKAALMH